METLERCHTMQEEIACLKQAQQYSVNLFDQIYDRLAQERALNALGETGVVALRAKYYNASAGVSTMPKEMELLTL